MYDVEIPAVMRTLAVLALERPSAALLASVWPGFGPAALEEAVSHARAARIEGAPDLPEPPGASWA